MSVDYLDERLIENKCPRTNVQSMTKGQMSNEGRQDVEGAKRRVFDLGERTAVFGESVITFSRRLVVDSISGPVISQLVRAATTVGANYCEADEADSRKEFRYRISLCRRESKETRFHLRTIVAAAPGCRDEARILWQEAKELMLIFNAILRKKKEQ